MGVTLRMSGLAELEGKLRKLAEQAGPIAGEAVKAEADLIMAASKDVCPVDTGALQASGQVQDVAVTAESATATLSYDTPYAIYVHEGHRIVAWGHDTGRLKDPDKFLETPMLEAIPGLESRLGAKIAAGIERVFG